MLLGAIRAGCADALRQELAESQPHLLAWLARQVPSMYPKAYRWVAEMEEMSKFLAADPGASQMLAGAARLYEQVAHDLDSKNPDGTVATIDKFLKT